MKIPSNVSTATNALQGTISFAGDAAFAANSTASIVEAGGPAWRPNLTGGEIVAVSRPDPSITAIPDGIVLEGVVYSIPGGNTLVGIIISNIRDVAQNVPAFDARFIVFPK